MIEDVLECQAYTLKGLKDNHVEMAYGVSDKRSGFPEYDLAHLQKLVNRAHQSFTSLKKRAETVEFGVGIAFLCFPQAKTDIVDRLKGSSI